jgi:hypothetical protein
LYENTIGANLSNESRGAPACVSVAAAVDPSRGCPILGQGRAVEVGDPLTNGEQLEQWLARH